MTAEKILIECLGHLPDAQECMGRLTATNDDWTAAAIVDEEFAAVVDAVKEYGRTVIGMNTAAVFRAF